MSRPEHRADEPDDATTELPKLPDAPAGSDPLDPASLAWTTGTAAEAAPPPYPGDPGLAPGAPPSELSDVSFPTAWRGYEPTAVDAYVRQVTRTIADLEGNRSPAEAVRRALDRVGEETSSILHEAEQTAERMTEKSRKQSAERIERAEREADEITLAARTRLRSLDADVDRIWLERQRLIDDTRRLAERLVQISDQAEERFPAEEDENTASDTTTVGDTPRAARGGDTVRFTPPDVDSPVPAAGEHPSPFGVDSEPAATDRIGAPALGGEPIEASRWSTPASIRGIDDSTILSAEHEAGDAGGPADTASAEDAGRGDTVDADAGAASDLGRGGESAPEDGLSSEREPGGDDEPMISWSTPEPEDEHTDPADPPHHDHES